MLAYFVAAVLLIWYSTVPELSSFKYLLIHALRTVFLLRVPLLCGAALFLLPVICTRLAPSMLGNLAEMRSTRQYLAVSFAIGITAMAVTRTLLTALENIPGRFNVPLTFPTEQVALDMALFTVSTRSLFVPVVVCLALPAFIWVTYRSGAVTRKAWPVVTAGLVLTLFLYFYDTFVAGSVRSLNLFREGAIWLDQYLAMNGYLYPASAPLSGRELHPTHLELLGFLILTLTFYVAGRWLFRPGGRLQAPALFLLLLLLTQVCLFVAGAAFFFDLYRVPVLFLAVSGSLASYYLWKVDHLFKLVPLRNKDSIHSGTLTDALRARLGRQGEGDKTLVVVTTAGGGVHAGAWTAKVLSSLDHELTKASDQPLSPSIGLISAVSGGSTGTMFYVDRLPESGAMDAATAKEVVAAATADNLDAIGWGLAYPDFWRLIGLPWLTRKRVDRGSALEDDWGGAMRKGDATFADWREDMLTGIKPVTVFNATWVQSGCRLLLSPFPLNEPAERQASDFCRSFPEHDIAVKTAARLSATFPFVTPIARDDQEIRLTHVADGGYFDNFGVFTAVNFLNDILLAEDGRGQSVATEFNVTRILVLEIRAFADTDISMTYTRFSGWIMQVFGPLITMFSIRRSTQTARNSVELENLIDYWNERLSDRDVRLEAAKLIFPEILKGTFQTFEVYTPPLSWKLSEAQKRAVEQGWNELLKGDEWRKLVSIWSGWHPRAARSSGDDIR